MKTLKIDYNEYNLIRAISNICGDLVREDGYDEYILMRFQRDFNEFLLLENDRAYNEEHNGNFLLGMSNIREYVVLGNTMGGKFIDDELLLNYIKSEIHDLMCYI